MAAQTTAGNDANGQPRRLPAGRKAALAAYVTELGQVTVAQLAERFDVSPDTIRRDLDQLDSEGVLIRTHGGAVSPSAVPRPETGLDIRLRMQTSAKEKIGALAASLVTDGAAIVVNGGTTTLALVRHLREHRELTVATNSLRIPAEISPDAYRDLYVFGGQVRHVSQATVGPVSFQRMSARDDVQIQCDLALIAVGAVDGESGYTTSNFSEAAMMAEMMDRASRVAVLADRSKFDRRLFAQVAELGRADYLVTDSAPSQDLSRALEAAGVKVLIADGDG
ncbi:DeoR/GlpR family DNA-binding transcription regulator [Jiangella gansuensis]|uniref:DeoR/GlpR family DNA-binding transcription regulator n=1 Tax=Jiangella gansuensis TaxID=281473 RepID=UPI00047D54DC|nr:DeoR/GlpR family DNA-binding transcription regulator [Jiangella gansuensis]